MRKNKRFQNDREDVESKVNSGSSSNLTTDNNIANVKKITKDCEATGDGGLSIGCCHAIFWHLLSKNEIIPKFLKME